MASKDLYQVLGVSRSATADEIRAAYRKLARKLHPDVNPGDAAAEERFKEISAAYSVLSESEKRKLYDQFGDVALQAGFDAKRAEQMRSFGGGGGSPFDFRGWSQGFSSGGSLEELLQGMLRGRGRGGMGGMPRKGADLTTELSVDLPLAVRGGTTTLRFDLRGREEIEVRIPAGIKDGQSLRLAGLGREGQGGGPSGDLLIKVKILAHPCYRREGDDLHIEVPITLAEAIEGGEVRFGGPTGEVAIKIAPGTDSGQSFRLRGLGVKGKGHLYARVLITRPAFPSSDEASARLTELARELQGFYGDDVRVKVQF